MSSVLRPVRFGERIVRVAAIAFDKDGTLLESEPFWHELWRLRRALIAGEAGEDVAAAWEQELGAAGGIFDRRGPFAVAPQTEEVVLLAGIFYRRLGWSWEECRRRSQEIHRVANEQLDLQRVAVPRPGAVALVRSLKQAGIAVGVVTSDEKTRSLRSLAGIGLSESTWDFFLTPADVRRPKPAPDMVEALCSLVGCPPAAVAVVGDSVVDLGMARAAGALGVGVPEYPDDAEFLAPLADVLLTGPHDIAVVEDEERSDG